MKLFRSPASRTVDQANFYHFVMDIAWFGLAVTATSRFMQVYAIRLDASPFQIGLLTSLPAIFALVSSILFSGWWRKRYTNSVRAVFWPGLFQRLIFLLPAFTPLFPPAWQPTWLIAAICLPAIGEGISAVVFLAMMREVIPDTTMPRLLSRRSLALNISVGFGAVAFGLMLEHVPFPINYQLMFVLAFSAGLISLWHVKCLHAQDVAITPKPELSRESNALPWRSHKFRQVAFAVVVTHIGFLSVYAVTPLHLINELGASEGYMALFGVMELMAGATTAAFITKILQRFGNINAIALAMATTGVASLIFALSPSLPLALLGAVLSGTGWTATGIGLFSYFTEKTRDVQPHDMVRYSRAYYQTIAISVFIGPLLGSSLANVGVSLITLLVVGALVRFFAALFTRQSVVERVFHAPNHARLGIGD